VDNDQRVFVKKCSKENACQVVVGELAGLEAIMSTSSVRVPKPLCTVFAPDASAAVIVMEFLTLSRLKSHEQLGQQLSLLHGHNEIVRQEHDSSVSIIGKYANNEEEPFITSFGFDEMTCCGHIPMNNQWVDDWECFFARNRLSEQIALIEENYGDRECSELWSKLQLVIPQFFREFRDSEQPIRPALLHGDLWSGNAAESDGGPVIFDPSSFYGHSEYDLAIGLMFGGFNKSFYTGYFGHKRGLSVTQEQRMDLYQLFHYLNHWNHFGSGYREQTVSLMRKLCKMFK
jgi:fructosamine-3-kinase